MLYLNQYKQFENTRFVSFTAKTGFFNNIPTDCSKKAKPNLQIKALSIDSGLNRRKTHVIVVTNTLQRLVCLRIVFFFPRTGCIQSAHNSLWSHLLKCSRKEIILLIPGAVVFLLLLCEILHCV